MARTHVVGGALAALVAVLPGLLTGCGDSGSNDSQSALDGGGDAGPPVPDGGAPTADVGSDGEPPADGRPPPGDASSLDAGGDVGLDAELDAAPGQPDGAPRPEDGGGDPDGPPPPPDGGPRPDAACSPADCPPPDRDGDGVPDDRDLCPELADPAQADADGDRVGDACDPDRDGDGRDDVVDTCPDAPDDGRDGDGDGVGDACDGCPADPANDGDRDGVCGDVDLCPEVADADQVDQDDDGLGDLCDADRDGDRIDDADDLCPDIADGGLDTDGDRQGDACDADDDADAVPDVLDLCPLIPDGDQSDVDADGFGDVCDPCPRDVGNDADRDGACGDVDVCPATADPDQADQDFDGEGDACDADRDGDGLDDEVDNCPASANPDQADDDGDGAGDLCDLPRCDDGVRNGFESGRDCGGNVCPLCGTDAGCVVDEDCRSGVCRGAVCLAPTCEDRVSNGDETGVDCGGDTCGRCGPDQGCVSAGDCLSGVCTDEVCQAPTCEDRVQNGDETDEDCGGLACDGCAVGERCLVDGDCDDADECTVETCVEARCASTAVGLVVGVSAVALDVSAVSPAEALAGDPASGTLYTRAQQNPAGFSIQISRIALDGALTRFAAFEGAQSSNLSGVAVDPRNGSVLFADERWNALGRIAAFDPDSLAVTTVFATPWKLNPRSNGLGMVRFATDPADPASLYFLDSSTAKIYALDRSIEPPLLRVVRDVGDGRADGDHLVYGNDLVMDAERGRLIYADGVTGEISALDPASGALAALANLGPGRPARRLRLGVHPGLGLLFVAEGPLVWTLPLAGGEIVPFLNYGLPADLVDLTVAPDPARPSGYSVYVLPNPEDLVHRLDFPNEACFAPATCQDRRRNGGEVGVDCGGPCTPCPAAPDCEVDADCDDVDGCTADSCLLGTCQHVVDPAQCPDADLDGDGLLNGTEALLLTDPRNPDTDADGTPDGLEDGDGDTLTNLSETRGGVQVDSDGDGAPDLLDPDSDDDTLLDSLEAGDADVATPAVDTDEDGTPDTLDLDSDADAIPDQTEAVEWNIDADDVRPSIDRDSDGDGLDDAAEGADDRDFDSTPDFLDPQDLRVESAHGVSPGTCEGEAGGGLCRGSFYTDVVFARRFDRPPHVLVAAEEVSAQQGCVGGATDKVVAYPANITERGFRLYAFGSPAPGSCGDSNGWATRAQAGWLAVEAGPGVTSAHRLTGDQCATGAQGGLCETSFHRDIRFNTPYPEIPNVLVAAEVVSNQGGCVGGATDKVVARASNVTREGFRLHIAGSPVSGSCGARDGWASVADAGYLVVPRGPQIESASRISPANCTGAITGGLCNGAFFEDVSFRVPFFSRPHVLVSGEIVSQQDGCVGGATDKVVAAPSAIANEGFRLFARGSVSGDGCGVGNDGQGTRAEAGFLAIQ